MQKVVAWASSMEGIVFVLTVLVTGLAFALAGFVSAYYRERAEASRKLVEMEKKVLHLERALWSLTDAEVKLTWKDHHAQREEGVKVGRAVVFHEKPGAPARVVVYEAPEAPFVGGYRTAPPRSEMPAPVLPARQWGRYIGQAMTIAGMIVVCAGWPSEMASAVGWALMTSGALLFVVSVVRSWPLHAK